MMSGIGNREWGIGLVVVAAFVIAVPAHGQATGAPRPAGAATTATTQAPTLDLTAVSLPIPPAGRRNKDGIAHGKRGHASRGSEHHLLLPTGQRRGETG